MLQEKYQQTRRQFTAKLAAASIVALTSFPTTCVVAEANDYDLDPIDQKPFHKPKIFESAEIGVGKPNKYLPKARVLEASLETQPSGYDNPIQVWAELMQKLQSADPATKITMINQFFNQVRYVADKQGNDVWKMPAEFLCQGGDCEDYAIAKFVSLRMLGFHPDRIRVLFVQDTITGLDHAITTVNYNDRIYVLDNMLSGVADSARLNHYLPICSFDDKRLWLHWISGKSESTVASLQQRLSRKQG